MLQGYAFNNDGLLTPEAIRILDSGCLTSISALFGKTQIDMEEKVFDGVFAKDLLHSTVTRELDELLAKVKLICFA